MTYVGINYDSSIPNEKIWFLPSPNEQKKTHKNLNLYLLLLVVFCVLVIPKVIYVNLNTIRYDMVDEQTDGQYILPNVDAMPFYIFGLRITN